MRYLLQSTEADIVVGPVVDTTAWAKKTDLAYNAAGIDADVYKNGAKADFALAGSPGAGYWRHVANGYYNVTLGTGAVDTCGRLRFTLDATGYTAPPVDYIVLPGAIYDAIVCGTDQLDVNVVEWLGLAAFSYTAPDNAAVSAIKVKTDNLPNDPADQSLLEAAIAAATSPLATAANLALVKDKTDQLTFTTPGKVDASASLGSGDKQVRLIIKNTLGVVIADAEVYVTTDAAGDQVTVGPVSTDAAGRTPILLLSAGTYYRWASKSGENFTNPQPFTVT